MDEINENLKSLDPDKSKIFLVVRYQFNNWVSSVFQRFQRFSGDVEKDF